MKPVARTRSVPVSRPGELAAIRQRLAEAEETLRAFRAGEVDSVVVAGHEGPRVFTLEGDEHPYRTLIERMNEGALILTSDKTVLYANECFARMVKEPLERLIGSSFRRFLSAEDLATVRPLVRRARRSGSKAQVVLRAADGSQVTAQISARPLPKDRKGGSNVGIVVTDTREARRGEEMLRALTHRVVAMQENERVQVALELHDEVTQLLCAVLFHTQALAKSLSGSEKAARKEARRLGAMIGRTIADVERISRGLRPGALDQLGIADVLRSTGAQFAIRTGVDVEVVCAELSVRLQSDTELALFRVLQEALGNVERHARARHVGVALTLQGAFVELSIADDGVGFDPKDPTGRGRKKPRLGLLSMRERTAYVGGSLAVSSSPERGTTVRVRMPVDGVRAHKRSG